MSVSDRHGRRRGRRIMDAVDAKRRVQARLKSEAGDICLGSSLSSSIYLTSHPFLIALFTSLNANCTPIRIVNPDDAGFGLEEREAARCRPLGSEILGDLCRPQPLAPHDCGCVALSHSWFIVPVPFHKYILSGSVRKTRDCRRTYPRCSDRPLRRDTTWP